jgi:hypothetical protein
MAVCDKTYQLLQRAPYAGLFAAIEHYGDVPLDDAQAFDCRRAKLRHPRETKGQEFDLTTSPPDSCCSDGRCC